jgi:hypothetical protein
MLRQSISSLLIGFGLFLFCFSILAGLSEESILFFLIAISFVLITFIWVLKERPKKLFSIRIIVTGAFIPLLVLLFLRFTEPLRLLLVLFFTDTMSLPLFLLACGFFSIGLIGLYLNTKAKPMVFLFIILAGLLLSLVPATAMYKDPFGEIRTPINQRYPIQLSLGSLAFFVFGALSMLHTKFGFPYNVLTKTQSADIATGAKLKESLTRAEPVVNRIQRVSFLLLLIGPLGFIGAAYVFHGSNMTAIMGNFTFLINYIFVASISAALLVIGVAFALYQKSKRALVLVVIGSVILVAAALVFVYEVGITEMPFPTKYPDLKVTHYETIYSQYALPLAIISILFCTIGLVLMLKARFSQKEGSTAHSIPENIIS